MPEKEPINWFLGSTTLAFITGAVGAFFGSRSKVTEQQCLERRDGCKQLNQLRDDALHEKVDLIIEMIKKG